MQPEESPVSDTMTRRLALVFAGALLVVLAAALWSSARVIDERQLQEAATHTVDLSGSVAGNLRARLMAADAVVENATSGDGAAGSTLLRQRLLRSGAFRSVAVLPWQSAFEATGNAPVLLRDPERQVLASGSALLRSQVVDGENRSLFLLRATTINGTAAVAFCEILPEWFWQGIAPVRSDSTVAVLDNTGKLLQATAPIPDQLLKVLAREHDHAQIETTPTSRTWNAAGVEWRGAIAAVPLDSDQLRTNRWLVIGYTRALITSPGVLAVGTALPALLLLAALIGAAAVWYLRRSWQPPLKALAAGLAELSEGRYQRVAIGEGRDTPREVAIGFNRAVGVIKNRMQALASLNEIDRLLLESVDIEQSLDAVLARVCKITACHGAALALLDPDVPGYARAYVAGSGDVEQPVNRINVDEELLRDLHEQRHGLTVTRCEPHRHSFLEPLRSVGAEFFWVWPVLAKDKVAAILSVGYLGVPAVPPEIAAYGTECAARLGVALSNRARGDELYRQAHYDALTSLPNRLLFRDRLSQELASASAGPQRGALLYVDLDHFKKVNDTVGHAAGDQLLQIVAQRLRSSVKDGDTVARLGGDEFTVILRSIGTPEAARQIASRIIESLQQPVNIAGRDHYVRASIGITLFPDDGNSLEDLMRNADLAMYRAKESGRSRALFYDRKMERGPTPVAESGLFRALRRREFSLYFQPQYSLGDGGLVGMEALLRWQPPREGLRYPGEFIPAAEQSGLIVDIGAWVLETACNQLAIWHEQGIAPPRLALNVSVHQLRQAEFAKIVRRALDRVGLPPEMLEFELTESVFADEDARQSMRRLAALGVRLSLDDFGTGYSSLGYLRQHPVQAIKIDRSFIEEVPHSVTAATLAETIIVMAHALGKQVVAEGVESIEQLEFLRERKCDIAQGFFLAQPRNVNETTEVLSARRPAELQPTAVAS